MSEYSYSWFTFDTLLCKNKSASSSIRVVTMITQFLCNEIARSDSFEKQKDMFMRTTSTYPSRYVYFWWSRVYIAIKTVETAPVFVWERCKLGLARSFSRWSDSSMPCARTQRRVQIYLVNHIPYGHKTCTIEHSKDSAIQWYLGILSQNGCKFSGFLAIASNVAVVLVEVEVQKENRKRVFEYQTNSSRNKKSCLLTKCWP